MAKKEKKKALKRMLVRFTPKEFLGSQALQAAVEKNRQLAEYLHAYQGAGTSLKPQLPQPYAPLLSGPLGQYGGWEAGKYPDIGYGVRGGWRF